MSGVGVAGLALGAFPLFVIAVKQGIEARRMIKDWWRVERVYVQVANQLTYSHTFLRLQLRKLVIPLVKDRSFTDQDLDALLDDPLSFQWQGNDANSALRRRLLDSHDEYFGVLERLIDKMAVLWQKLGANEPGFKDMIAQRLASTIQPKSTTNLMSRAHAKFQYQRAKLTLTKQGIKDLLDDVQSCLNRLESLLRAVDEVSRLSEQLDQPALPIHSRLEILSYPKEAIRIYDLLVSSLGCNCPTPHFAHVLLQQQAQVVMQMRMFSGSNDMSEKTHQDVRITKKHLPLEMIRRQGVKASEFSLCETLGTNNKEELKQDYELGYPFTVSFDSLLLPASSTAKQLPDALALAHELAPSRLDRYQIALHLARATLQFYLTPWLQQEPSCECIEIPQMPDGSLQIGHAYTVTTFHTAKTTAPSSVQQGMPFRKIAMALLELCFGRRITDHDEWAQVQRCADDKTRRYAISGLLQELTKKSLRETGRTYQAVVEWCLQQDEKTIEDVGWRLKFASKVVCPLEECCKWMSQTRE